MDVRPSGVLRRGARRIAAGGSRRSGSVEGLDSCGFRHTSPHEVLEAWPRSLSLEGEADAIPGTPRWILVACERLADGLAGFGVPQPCRLVPRRGGDALTVDGVSWRRTSPGRGRGMRGRGARWRRCCGLGRDLRGVGRGW